MKSERPCSVAKDSFTLVARSMTPPSPSHSFGVEVFGACLKIGAGDLVPTDVELELDTHFQGLSRESRHVSGSSGSPLRPLAARFMRDQS